MPKLTSILLILSTFYCSFSVEGQESAAISDIIQQIYDLEKNKDPKCYATANRLEDFMYGTPLTEDARNFKIEIQKSIILYLKEKATSIARANNQPAIQPKHLKQVIDDLSDYDINTKGDFLYRLTTGTITILNKDYRQYASVSYGYRSLLSVEQDLMYFPEIEVLPFQTEALQIANKYVNLLTLVTLKIADINARKANKNVITKEQLQDTWLLILAESKNKNTVQDVSSYPNTNEEAASYNQRSNDLIKKIIVQKLASYETYNQVAENVFLRNIQVYFAKQKWPTDFKISEKLRSYYLESLIQFTSSLLQQSTLMAASNNHAIIRVGDVQEALHLFLPSTTNTFEDVTFFPNLDKDKISLESYDLDAFRDSGFHWRILGYALNDEQSNYKNLDPNAAEQLVEGIAQMGVLVLRLAGAYSHQLERPTLTLNDIENGFIQIQNLIKTYDFQKKPKTKTAIASSKTTINITTGFADITNGSGIEFEHKSADWLNRLIRGYTTSYAEGAIKLAIPPAFGGSGVACEDVNGDKLTDVLLLGGFGNKLYINAGNNTFTDLTKESGLNSWNDTLQAYGEVRQPIIADFNNDGTQDIFISYVNAPHKIYKNTNNNSFSDVSALSNLGGENAVAGPATAFDYNNDGLLDIFIGYFGNYIEGTLPTLKRDNNNGLPNRLFKNIGNFVFEEVVFTQNEASNRGWTQALGHSDINQDGLQDIIVGNDFGKNKYYLNSESGLFTESSETLGTDKPSYTMNVGITDLNKDLYPDFYISNIVVMQKDEKYVSPNENTQMKFDKEKMANIRTIEANDLFLSNVDKNGATQYQLSTNIGRGYSATGWSWDADFFDYDNDGDEDLYCLNGMNDFSVYSSENPFYFERKEASKSVVYAPSNKERNVFFVNNGGQLINQASELGVDLNSNARSASYADFDGDGDLDIIINNYHEQATLLENKTSNSYHYIKIKLIGAPSEKINRDAIGSTLILNSATHKNIWREIHSTSGYLSVHPKEQHFGLGTDTSVDVEIRWSNGTVATVKNLEADASYEISYPDIVQTISAKK